VLLGIHNARVIESMGMAWDTGTSPVIDSQPYNPLHVELDNRHRRGNPSPLLRDKISETIGGVVGRTFGTC
jgi:hypothetical protein